jgi:hypothetical protein
VITAWLQRVDEQIKAAGHYGRTSWSLVNAVIAVVAGISTSNLAVADCGFATISELASPLMQQFGGAEREA